MIRVLVLYPDGPEAKFDYDYYVDVHMPLVKDRFGSYMQGYEVDKGLSAVIGAGPAPYVVTTHLFFNSLEDYQKVVSQHLEELSADIPNYTNIQPDIQIDEVATIVKPE